MSVSLHETTMRRGHLIPLVSVCVSSETTYQVREMLLARPAKRRLVARMVEAYLDGVMRELEPLGRKHEKALLARRGRRK